MSTKMKVKKGDLVQIVAGKDRGKQGRVIEARPSERRVIVENLNVAKRHTKPKPIRDSSRMGGAQILPGGIMDKPLPCGLERDGRVPPSAASDQVGVVKEIQSGVVRVRVCKRGAEQELDR